MPGTWVGAEEYWHWDAGRPEGLFFMAADPLGQQRSEPTKTRHFGVVIARKNFLKKVCENLLTLSR